MTLFKGNTRLLGKLERFKGEVINVTCWSQQTLTCTTNDTLDPVPISITLDVFFFSSPTRQAIYRKSIEIENNQIKSPSPLNPFQFVCDQPDHLVVMVPCSCYVVQGDWSLPCLANADQRAEPRSCRLPLDHVSKVKDKKVKK